MIINRYNWEDGAIDWEFLNLNWEDVLFKIISNTITVTVYGVGSTVVISKEVLDNMSVSVDDVNFDKGISVEIHDLNIEPKGVTVNNVTFTDT